MQRDVASNFADFVGKPPNVYSPLAPVINAVPEKNSSMGKNRSAHNIIKTKHHGFARILRKLLYEK